ncbi:alcohol dehydrogenase [Gammaproteobacteria bacterium 45_16_T64]|nr:alcohol dehydrogenase [Gammaproteobacteria bacterium 45_16_T64]
MLFSLQVKGYKSIIAGFKALSKVLPVPQPTVFSGPGSSLELCRSMAHLGEKNVLIVTDKVLRELGLLDPVMAELESLGVTVAVYDGVLPDPTNDQVENGVEILKQHNCGAVLAFGGGSSLDAAKVISARATNDKTVDQLKGVLKLRNAPLPLYVIPTTAGTGSEVSIAAVVSDSVTHQKSLVLDPKLVPRMAALDGALMTGLPPLVTAATGMDALTHAVEAYVSTMSTEESDRLALAATRMIMENLPKAIENGKDEGVRQAMATGSSYAGMAMTRASLGYVHAIAHTFGAKYHTPHGIANALTLPHVLDYCKFGSEDRLAKLAEVSGLPVAGKTDREAAQLFIDRIRQMLVEFGITETLEALNKEDIPQLAKDALKEAHYNYPVPRYMDQKTCEAVIEKLLVA